MPDYFIFVRSVSRRRCVTRTHTYTRLHAMLPPMSVYGVSACICVYIGECVRLYAAVDAAKCLVVFNLDFEIPFSCDFAIFLNFSAKPKLLFVHYFSVLFILASIAARISFRLRFAVSLFCITIEMIRSGLHWCLSLHNGNCESQSQWALHSEFSIFIYSDRFIYFPFASFNYKHCVWERVTTCLW